MVSFILHYSILFLVVINFLALIQFFVLIPPHLMVLTNIIFVSMYFLQLNIWILRRPSRNRIDSIRTPHRMNNPEHWKQVWLLVTQSSPWSHPSNVVEPLNPLPGLMSNLSIFFAPIKLTGKHPFLLPQLLGYKLINLDSTEVRLLILRLDPTQ